MATLADKYRTWDHHLTVPVIFSFWPIARSGLYLIFRQKLFWVLGVLGLFNFIFHFAVIFLLAQIQANAGPSSSFIMPFLRSFTFTGTGEAYRDFIFLQSAALMLLLSLAGNSLIGNDFRSNAIGYYLSKPVGRRHYFVGKLFAATLVGMLMTLFPAMILFIEYGSYTASMDYWSTHMHVFWGICVYGFIAAFFPAVIVLGVSVIMKRGISIIGACATLFLLIPVVTHLLRLIFSRRFGGDAWQWSLLNFWKVLSWVVEPVFEIERNESRPTLAWPDPQNPAIRIAWDDRIFWSFVILCIWLLAATAAFWLRLRRAGGRV